MVGQRCGAAMYGYHESQRVYQTSSRSSWVERGNGTSRSYGPPSTSDASRAS